MATDLKQELHRLYADASKHSTYQSIPDFVSAKLGYSEVIDEGWRGDRPRLAYLLRHRTPQAGEHWGDFGANTGFFTLSLAKEYPQARFTAIEGNANHTGFIRRIVEHFALDNVQVIERAIGLNGLRELPDFDFLLHLNVLHHAGHDFDTDLVRDIDEFPDYAERYLKLLDAKTEGLFFQMGSNLWGDKGHPLVAVRNDKEKLKLFSQWLRNSGWGIDKVAYATRNHGDEVFYRDIFDFAGDEFVTTDSAIDETITTKLRDLELDQFPGEFYRRPLFLCRGNSISVRNNAHD